jgi:hypothetical protein
MSLESPLLAPSDRDKMELLEAPPPSPARSAQSADESAQRKAARRSPAAT